MEDTTSWLIDDTGEAEDDNSQEVLLKDVRRAKRELMLRDASARRRLDNEIRVLQRVRHPHIVRLFETFESPKRIHLVMEYVSHGTLYRHLKKHKKLAEPEARRLSVAADRPDHVHTTYLLLKRQLERDAPGAGGDDAITEVEELGVS